MKRYHVFFLVLMVFFGSNVKGSEENPQTTTNMTQIAIQQENQQSDIQNEIIKKIYNKREYNYWKVDKYLEMPKIVLTNDKSSENLIEQNIKLIDRVSYEAWNSGYDCVKKNQKVIHSIEKVALIISGIIFCLFMQILKNNSFLP